MKEKNRASSILPLRKDMKRDSHRILRHHYLLMIFLMIVMILFGTEFRFSRTGIGDLSTAAVGEKEAEPGNIISANDVLSDVLSGRIKNAVARSNRHLKVILESSKNNKVWGRAEGILASFVNSIASGSLLARIGQALWSVLRSESATSTVFIILSLLWYGLIFTFLSNVYPVVLRRVYMEARIYDRVPFPDILHLIAVRGWLKASWTMLVNYVYHLLWYCTIIGGIIKYYSYAAVPFIVAENPSLKANEAITLSRKMMDGHKMELFLFDLSMIGWVLLSVITLGISDMVYGAAYRIACRTEFYVKVREDAMARGVEGVERLDDTYLYAKADRILLYETYFEVVDEITLIHENRVDLTGACRRSVRWFGVWLGNPEKKKRYDDQEGRKFAAESYRYVMDGKAYPNWLNPRWRRKTMAKLPPFSYLRTYSIMSLFLLYILFSFIGWSWEVALHYMQRGEFANRGTLHGPWLPIYGGGGIIVLLLCSRFRKKPILEFLTAAGLCGTMEYFAGWFLEARFHHRWWSYDGYFLNLHGRICAEGLLVFGVASCIIVYLAAPLFDYLFSKISRRVQIIACIVLAILYGADQAYSLFSPNVSKGAVHKLAEKDEQKKTGG